MVKHKSPKLDLGSNFSSVMYDPWGLKLQNLPELQFPYLQNVGRDR